MHPDPAQVLAADLALTGVQPGAHLQTQGLHRIANRHRTADRALRAVEYRQKPVTGGVDLATPKPGQLCAHYRIMRIEQRMPLPVTQLRGASRRIHNVGEQHRSQHPIVGHVGLMTCEKLGDLLKGRTPRLHEVIHVAPWQLNVFGAGYLIGDVLAHRARDEHIIDVLEHEGRRADCREDRPHVQLAHYGQHAGESPWTRR
ncbi:hypothetical protein A5791_02310 [Mycobacterium sp. 852002-51163_SCH5372311]|nr:hypothetical protein A5791_02310 [Mycobacterium sp. 852002-51163_SCH5372311]